MYNGINKLNWDYEISGSDPFEDAKYIIEIGMSVADEFVPVLGTVIGGLLELFFPSHQRKREEVWHRAIEEVERHVDQKIDELTFNTMQAEVTALGQSFRDFIETVKNASPETIRTKFQNPNSNVLGYLQHRVWHSRRWRLCGHHLFKSFGQYDGDRNSFSNVGSSFEYSD